MSEINKILKNQFGIERKAKPTKQDNRLREKLAIEESLRLEQQLVEEVNEIKQKAIEEELLRDIEERRRVEQESLRLKEQSKFVEEKSLSEDDMKKLDAFSGLIKSFGVEIEPEIVEEDLQLQIKDIKPVIVEEPKIDESKKIEALETLFSGLTALKPKPLVLETKTPEPVKSVPVVVSQTPVDIREAVKLVKDKTLPTKQETMESTQKLITDVVNNLEDMKGKTEVKEQIDEIDALRGEFNTLQKQVRQSQITIGGLSGSGGGLDPNKIAHNLLPAADDTFDLGSASKQWRNLYLGGSTLIIDGASLAAGELTVLDSITAGTVAASKAVIVDSNKDISGFRNVTITGNIVIPNAGNIGSASDTDAIAIASNGIVTFSQAPVFPDGSIAVADLDIDGATDINADIVDADLFIIDDGAGGTNRKVTASRIKTYIGDHTDSLAADNITVGDDAVNITTSSGNITIDAAANDSDIIFKGTDGSADITMLTLDGSNAGDATFNRNVTVTGDLTVNGDTTTVNTATLSVEDPLIKLANGNNSSDSLDVGFYGLYDTSGSQDLFAGLFRDANDSGKFKLFKDLQAEPTTTVNTSGTGYAVATLVANIEGNITGDVTGNTSGTAATVTGAAQTNITSLGTLTTLTVDSIIINGTNIGHTSDTDAIAIAADGVVTFSQVPVLPADTIETADIQDNAVTPAKIAGAVNAQTGTSYTSVLADAFKTVTMSNGSANKLTIPPNSSVAYAIGDRIDVVMLGSGTTSIQGGTGVTLNAVSTGTVAIAAQFAAVSCLKIATDTWVAMGNHGGVS